MGCKSILGFVILFLASIWKTDVNGLCLQPCDRPTYCNDGDVTAIPGECNTYYLCQFSQWMVQPCAPGSVFNMSNIGQPGEVCECVLEILDPSCPYNCPTDDPPTSLPPGPCDNIPDECENGTKYADQSNCTQYYLCVEAELELNQCEVGPEHGYCNVTGLPCVFDINIGQCLHPDRNFDCETRCTAQIQQPQKDSAEEEMDDDILQATSVAPGPVCLSRARVCNRPPYCSEGEKIAEATACSQYYQCVYGYWQLYNCALGSQFDSELCMCVIEGGADCDYNCDATTTPAPNPGPCSNIDQCFVEQRRVADSTDCEDFHVCVDGEWQKRNCIGGTSDDCDQTGYACAYDTVTERCIHPDSSFNCEPRCPTVSDHRNQVDGQQVDKAYIHPKDVKTYLANLEHAMKAKSQNHVGPQGFKPIHDKSGPLMMMMMKNDIDEDSEQKDSVTG